MNMLTVDTNPPNPISSFLQTLTLEDSRELFVLPIIDDTDLDLFDLGLEEVFMTNTEPKVEEKMMFFVLNSLHLDHHQSFLHHPLFHNIKQG